MSLAKNISAHLQKHSLTANAASEMAGLERGYVRDIIRGKVKEPSHAKLRALAGIFGTTPEALAEGGHEPAFGQRVRLARESRGWSQAELASQVGTTQQSVDRIERGQTAFSRYIPMIASALDLGEHPSSPTPEMRVASPLALRISGAPKVRLEISMDVDPEVAIEVLRLLKVAQE